MILHWLPALIRFEDYHGDWDRYLDALYAFFKQDFIDTRPTYAGRRLSLKRHPVTAGKEATFWHLIQEGATESQRIPDLRRCERIRWPRPVISHSEDAVIKVWKNRRKGESRICLWLESEDYLVVLADRRGYLLLWTAYVVDKPHRRRKLRKEYETYIKNSPRNG